MISVLIAAHDEGAVIGRCLESVLADARPGELQVIVAANGCTDDTAAVARAVPGVRVVESPVPGKTAALNLAEEVAHGFPRIYLDADIPATTATVRTVARALDRPGALAAAPARRLDLRGRPLAVRAYYAVHGRLPVLQRALFGRGMVALSAAGRQRFGRFPDVVADDLFLDGLFAPHEKVSVGEVHTTVATPLRTADLVRRLSRVRRGNAELRSQAPGHAAAAPPADRWSWLRDVVLPRPWLAPAAVVYAAITGYAAWLARRPSQSWGRDDSSRIATGTT